MLQLLVDGDLPSEDVQNFVVLDFVQFLHCHLEPCWLMHSKLYNPITTFAYYFVKSEFIKFDFGEDFFLLFLLRGLFGRFSEE